MGLVRIVALQKYWLNSNNFMAHCQLYYNSCKSFGFALTLVWLSFLVVRGTEASRKVEVVAKNDREAGK